MSEPTRLDPQDWEKALRWLQYADDDLRAAALLANDSELIGAASFHRQQAAEKIAKAALVAFGKAYPKIHDVGELAQLVAPFMPDLGKGLQEMGGLTDWYFTSRYPDLDFMPTELDVRKALVGLKHLRQQIETLAPAPGE